MCSCCCALCFKFLLGCDINEHMVPINYYFIWVGCVYTIFYPCEYVHFLLFLTTEGLLMVGSLRSIPAQDCWASCPYLYPVFATLFTFLFIQLSSWLTSSWIIHLLHPWVPWFYPSSLFIFLLSVWQNNCNQLQKLTVHPLRQDWFSLIPVASFVLCITSVALDVSETNVSYILIVYFDLMVIPLKTQLPKAHQCFC